MITADSLRTVSLTIVSAQCEGGGSLVPAGATVTVISTADPTAAPRQVKEMVPLKVCPLRWGALAKTRVVASAGAQTLAALAEVGTGRLVVLASSGVASASQVALPMSSSTSQAIDSKLPIPYPIARHAHIILEDIFSHQAVFQVENITGSSVPSLNFVATRRAASEYLLGVANTQLSQRPFKINSQLGPIKSVEEIKLDDAKLASCSTPGYMPTHAPKGVDCGSDSWDEIAGLSQRIFSVKLESESNTSIIEPEAPPLPRARGLPLTGTGGLVEQILQRPSFFQHWDTIVVDWQYVEVRDRSALVEDASWAIRQRLRIVVDFTSGANLFPDLRFCNNSAVQYEASIARVAAVFDKMVSSMHSDSPNRPNGVFSQEAILAFHRAPENYYTASQCLAEFALAGACLAQAAAPHNISIFVRVGLEGKPPADLPSAALLKAMGSPRNVRLALQVASVSTGPATGSAAPFLPLVGAWMLAGRAADVFNGGYLGMNAPLACLEAEEARWVSDWLSKRTRGSLLLLDASLPHELREAEDAEFEELLALKALEHQEVPPRIQGCPGVNIQPQNLQYV